MEILNICSISILKKVFRRTKTVLQNWCTAFYLNILLLKAQHFHAKDPCQKPKLRQIKQGVQNGPTTKVGVLPLTTLFFGKFNLSIRISFK